MIFDDWMVITETIPSILTKLTGEGWEYDDELEGWISSDEFIPVDALPDDDSDDVRTISILWNILDMLEEVKDNHKIRRLRSVVEEIEEEAFTRIISKLLEKKRRIPHA